MSWGATLVIAVIMTIFAKVGLNALVDHCMEPFSVFRQIELAEASRIKACEVYTDDLSELSVDTSNCRWEYKLVLTPCGYKATASQNKDRDPLLDIWEEDQSGEESHIQRD